jgi:hypothetical protein
MLLPSSIVNISTIVGYDLNTKFLVRCMVLHGIKSVRMRERVYRLEIALYRINMLFPNICSASWI